MYGNSSQSLYINNLNDKIRKEELKLCLYSLFSTYGRVLDVITVKTPKMRGQAHVVFVDVPSAVQAQRSLQGMNFLGKELDFDANQAVILYCKFEHMVEFEQTARNFDYIGTLADLNLENSICQRQI
ncbi:hypothetical protein V1512DRAFT_254750 [Lipomyces arxii]|uniref:uncharacterized protein n=1 Tax=Lipomyces arxii TaxID=56418 RepID=UPI0034CD405D